MLQIKFLDMWHLDFVNSNTVFKKNVSIFIFQPAIEFLDT